MPAVTNLTFAQVNTEVGSAAFTFDAGTSDILLSVKAITGDTYTGLTDAAFVEFIWKLREFAAEAQATVNDGKPAADQLISFPARTAGVFDTASYSQPLTGTIRVEIKADPNNVVGSNP